MTPETLDRVALIGGAVLTVMIFSYLLGDNFLYRIAISIFIGALAKSLAHFRCTSDGKGRLVRPANCHLWLGRSITS